MKPIIDLPSDYTLLPGEVYKALDVDEEMPTHYYVGQVSPSVAKRGNSNDPVYWFNTRENKVYARRFDLASWELCDLST
jgi:hypothetical protein